VNNARNTTASIVGAASAQEAMRNTNKGVKVEKKTNDD
jgi:hypothetical protein